MKRLSVHVLASFVLLISGLVFAPHQSFTVNSTECYLDSQTCPAVLETASSSLIGSSYLFTDIVHSVNQLQDVSSTSYRATRYSITFPGKLSIWFSQEPIVYSLISTDARVSVTESGYVISYQEGFPELKYPQTPSEAVLPQDLHMQLLRSAQLPDQLSVSDAEISWINEFQVEVVIPNTITYVLNPQDLETGIWAIQTVQKQRVQEQFEANQVLDVRFRMPVLRTP